MHIIFISLCMKIKILEEDRNIFNDAVKAIGDKRYYVYAHYRESDNKLFYIGKGCKYRCTVVYRRNEYWLRVARKHGVYLKIIQIGLTVKESSELEIKLIADVGLNNLTNIARGGEDGLVGELNPMFGVRLLGSDNGNYGNKFAKNPLSIPIVCLDGQGKFVKEYGGSKETQLDGFSPQTVIACCKGKRQHHLDRIFVYKSQYSSEINYSINRVATMKRKVHCFDLFGNLIKEYNSTQETATDGYSPKNVQAVATGKKKTHLSKIFKYV